MAFKLLDNARMTVSAPGTGAFTFVSAPTGWQTFASAGAASGDVTPYRADDGGANWEQGLLTFGAGAASASRAVTASSNGGAAVNFTGSVTVTAVARAVDIASTTVGTARERLTADRTYYVRTDGSDSNNGLSNSPGGAFLTIQKAINVVAALDIGTFNVTIQVGNGTYTAGAIVQGPWLGSGTVTLLGNTTTPSNVVISVTNNFGVQVTSGGRLTVKGFKITVATAGAALSAIGGSNLTFGNIEFGSTAWYHISAQSQSTATCEGIGDYTVSGGAGLAHIYAENSSVVSIAGRTVTLTGTPALTITAQAVNCGVLRAHSAVFSGSATGQRYNASGCGVIYTGGGGANYFPGNSAGAAATGGQYI